MKYGSRLVVSSGEGSFCAYFIEWIGSSDKMKCLNKLGKIVILSQHDVLEIFV